IRLAMPEDLPRIAFVLMTGFSFSPVNQLQRPNYLQYPGDTFNSYLLELVNVCLDPSGRVYVTEDSYSPDEANHVPKKFAKRYLCPEKLGDKLIVGVAGFTGLGHRSIASDTKGVCNVHSIQDMGRDKDLEAVKSYKEQTQSAKEEAFKECKISLQTLVVQPSYWGRGHGTALAQACAILGDSRGSKISASATFMSEQILTRVGFQ
ncbi:hypothetical protein K432DRAFT_281440, partial [Lepidopterella palustris CBS 459.81]